MTNNTSENKLIKCGYIVRCPFVVWVIITESVFKDVQDEKKLRQLDVQLNEMTINKDVKYICEYMIAVCSESIYRGSKYSSHETIYIKYKIFY